MTRSLIAIIAAASLSAVIPQYVELGFTHILPDGLDHILFILGLFFLGRSFEALLVQITLFTIAHSLTLGLSLYGVVSLPTRIVEIAIALSIAFIGIENLFQNRLSRWRPLMVFAFGLIHGLGFAHTFEQTSVPTDDFLPALFSYNIGIELGQLAVVAVTFAAVGMWWKRDWYCKVIARPVSGAIAFTGLCYAVSRSSGM